MGRFIEYQVLGRKLPTEAEPAPKVRLSSLSSSGRPLALGHCVQER